MRKTSMAGGYVKRVISIRARGMRSNTTIITSAYLLNLEDIHLEIGNNREDPAQTDL